MRCPICETLLITEHRLEVEVDTCPSCGGMWLDRGELNAIVERSADDASPITSDEGPAIAGFGDGPGRSAVGRRSAPSFWMTVLNAD